MYQLIFLVINKLSNIIAAESNTVSLLLFGQLLKNLLADQTEGIFVNIIFTWCEIKSARIYYRIFNLLQNS